MTLGEKASYVKGLIEGFDLDKDKKESKAIIAIADLLEDIAGSVVELENSVDDVTDQVEDMIDEINDIDDQICDCHKDRKHNDSCNCDHEDDSLFYEVECPACNTTVCLAEDSIINNDIMCPNCGQKIDIDIDGCDCEDCDCEDCDCDDTASESSED